MLLPSTRFDLPFVVVDSSGVPTAPDSTPTAVLVKNGTDLGTTVTVTMSTAQGVASCTLPSDAAAGDRFYIRVAAVVSGTTYTVPGPVSVCGPFDANVTKISGDSTAADNLEAACDGNGYNVGAGQIVAASVTGNVNLPTIPAGWVTSIQSGLATSSAVADLQTSVNDLPTNAELTTALGSGTWMTAVPWNAAWDAEVQSECTDALITYAPATSTDMAVLASYVNTEVGAIKAKTDNLPASPAAVGSAMTLTSGERDSIATSVWASTTRSLTTFGTLVSDVSTAVWSAATRTLSGFGTLTADVWAYATRTLTSGGGGGGSTTVVVHPGYASWAERVFGQVLVVFHNEAGTIGPVLCQRLNNRVLEDIDLSALTGLYFLVKDYLGEEVYTTSSVTISGAEDSQFTVPITTTLTGTTTKETEEEWHYWSLRDEDDNVVVGGRLRVQML